MARQEQELLKAIDHEIAKLREARAILAGQDEAAVDTARAARGSTA